MGVSPSGDDTGLGEYLESRERDLHAMRQGLSQLNEVLEQAREAATEGEASNRLHGAVTMRLDERTRSVHFEIDDARRRSLTPAELRDAFAVSFASAPLPVDVRELASFMRRTDTSLGGDRGRVPRAPEQSLHTPDGKLTLVTVFGKPARIEASDSWTMSEPSESLAAAVGALVEQALRLENEGVTHE